MKTWFLVLIGLAVTVGFAGEHTFKTATVEKKNYYKGMVRYPVFQDKFEIDRFVNARIIRWTTKSLQDFAQQTMEAQKGLGQPRVPYELHATSTVTMHTMRLISCYFTVYMYTGGAHGNTAFVPFNFGILRGKVTPLKLADLFKPDFNYREVLNDLLMSKLSHDDRAAWVQEGSVSRVTNTQMERFVILPDGILFLFEPYEMGPYAVGTFKVKVGFEEIGLGHLNRGLLFAR